MRDINHSICATDVSAVRISEASADVMYGAMTMPLLANFSRCKVPDLHGGRKALGERRCSRKPAAPCVLGHTFGCDVTRGLLWVSGGCRGRFLCDDRQTSICGVRSSTKRTYCTCGEAMATVTPSSGSLLAPLPLVDVFIFNDEEDMLLYRLRLHASFGFAKFIVVESNITFSGIPKTLRAQSILSTWVARPIGLQITVLEVPFTVKERTSKDPWQREVVQREFINRFVATNFRNHRLFVSDVDELLDAPALWRAISASPTLQGADCVLGRMRAYYYSEMCQYKRDWTNALLLRTDGPTFATIVKEGEQLRSSSTFVRGLCRCISRTELVGWHFSHAMSTASILHKLRSYSHSKDAQQRKLNSLPTNVSTQLVEDRIRKCDDLLGRAGVIFQAKESAFDGVLPPIAGWPRHPQAPRATVGGIAATLNATTTPLRATHGQHVLRAHKLAAAGSRRGRGHLQRSQGRQQPYQGRQQPYQEDRTHSDKAVAPTTDSRDPMGHV